MHGPESHRSPRPLRFRQKLASVYVFRPRLLEKRVPDRRTRQACAVIGTKKARKDRRLEDNHNQMNLLRRSSNIPQATVINGLPPSEAAPSPSVSVSRVGFASYQGFPPLCVLPLIAALENLLKPAFPSCKDKGVLQGVPAHESRAAFFAVHQRPLTAAGGLYPVSGGKCRRVKRFAV